MDLTEYPPPLDADFLLDCPTSEYGETLVCPICYEISSLTDAVVFYPCGHTLCRRCQTEVFSQYGSWCPIDKQPVAFRSRNRMVEQVVRGLKCKCDNSVSHPSIQNKEVCEVILTLENRTRHLRNCPFTLITCKYSKRGCTEECLRRDLEDHQENCAFNLEECPNFGCDFTGRSCTIAEHRQDCEWELIHCKARSFGCKAFICRKDYNAHQNSCPFIEQKLIQDSKLDEIRKEVDELYRQVGELLRDEDNSFSALDIVE